MYNIAKCLSQQSFLIFTLVRSDNYKQLLRFQEKSYGDDDGDDDDKGKIW